MSGLINGGCVHEIFEINKSISLSWDKIKYLTLQLSLIENDWYLSFHLSEKYNSNHWKKLFCIKYLKKHECIFVVRVSPFTKSAHVRGDQNGTYPFFPNKKSSYYLIQDFYYKYTKYF